MTLGKNSLAIVAKFSQALASNEVKIRNQGFKKVSSYLVKKSLEPGGIVGDEMLNIWKGLFYCMWMSDKPDVQEKLASRMADVLLELKSDEAKQIYFEEFLTTMQREWTGIDRLRMDKYFLLFRFMFQRCFQYLKSTNWNEKQVTWFLTLLKEGPLHPHNINTRNCPLGIRYHITDIYLDELESCCDDVLSGKKLTLMLEPFCLTLQQTKIEDLCTRILDKIFQVIIDKSPPALKIIYETTNMKVEGLKFQFDYSSIADMLFEHAQLKGIQNKNRKLLYANVKKFRELASGDVALDEFPDLTAFDGLTENSVSEEHLVETLTKQYDEDHIESLKEKRQMKKLRKSAKVVEHEPFSIDVIMSENDGEVPVAATPDDDVTAMDVEPDDVAKEVVADEEAETKVEVKKPKKKKNKQLAKKVDNVEPAPIVEEPTAVESSEVSAAVAPNNDQPDTSDEKSADTSIESTSAKKKSPKLSGRGLSRSGKRRFRRRMAQMKLARENAVSAGVAVVEGNQEEEQKTEDNNKPQAEVAEKQPEIVASEPEKLHTKESPKVAGKQPEIVASEPEILPTKESPKVAEKQPEIVASEPEILPTKESPKVASPEVEKVDTNGKTAAADARAEKKKKAKRRRSQCFSELKPAEDAPAVKVVVEAKPEEESTPAVVEVNAEAKKKKKKKRRASMTPTEVTESLDESTAMMSQSLILDNPAPSEQNDGVLFPVPDWDDMEEKAPAFMKASVIKLKAKKKQKKVSKTTVLQTPPPRPAADSSHLTKSGKKVVFAISKNQVKPFRAGDRPLVVGKKGVTGVAFDPTATPDTSLLKKRIRPTSEVKIGIKKMRKQADSKTNMKKPKRKSASDFF